jgi:hypothetical protein
MEALGKMLLAEFFGHGGIGEIGLGDEFRGRIKILFLLPVNGDLRFAYALMAVDFVLRGLTWNAFSGATFGQGGNSPLKNQPIL